MLACLLRPQHPPATGHPLLDTAPRHPATVHPRQATAPRLPATDTLAAESVRAVVYSGLDAPLQVMITNESESGDEHDVTINNTKHSLFFAFAFTVLVVVTNKTMLYRRNHAGKPVGVRSIRLSGH